MDTTQLSVEYERVVAENKALYVRIADLSRDNQALEQRWKNQVHTSNLYQTERAAIAHALQLWGLTLMPNGDLRPCLTKSELAHIHDAVYGGCNISFTDEDLYGVLSGIPDSIRNEANMHGWHDTPVREALMTWAAETLVVNDK